MDERADVGIADVSVDAPADSHALIASLRGAGAERFDPVRLHYIDVLARRAAAHEGGIKRMLDARLAQAIVAFRERFELARSEAREMVAQSVQQYPQAANDLQQRLVEGDFKSLRLHVAALKVGEQCASLSALVRQLEQHPAQQVQARPERNAAPRPELKTIRNFRDTWSKLSVEKQVTQALGQAPKNAGPINSHMLVLRSLELMRNISPDYLNRFMSYADTLLSLDQGEPEKPVSPKKPQAARKTKK